MTTLVVTPAKAGVQAFLIPTKVGVFSRDPGFRRDENQFWIPAFAGMTEESAPDSGPSPFQHRIHLLGREFDLGGFL